MEQAYINEKECWIQVEQVCKEHAISEVVEEREDTNDREFVIKKAQRELTECLLEKSHKCDQLEELMKHAVSHSTEDLLAQMKARGDIFPEADPEDMEEIDGESSDIENEYMPEFDNPYFG